MKKNRLAALLLALVLMASIIPVTAMADAFKVGDQVQVTSSYLRYRAGWGTDHSIICMYPNGTKCTVLEISPKGLWFRCKMPDGKTSGWFWGGYLKKIGSSSSPTGDTSVAGNYVVSNRGMYVNLRDTANGTILTKVPDGATVKVISAAKGWSQVTYGSFTGYMMSHFLVKK